MHRKRERERGFGTLKREREILVCAKQSKEKERGLERKSEMRKRAKHALAVAAVEFAIFFHARF